MRNVLWQQRFLLFMVLAVSAVGCTDHITEPSKTTPLMGAVIGGNLGLVRTLLKKGVDVNGRNEDGNTALTFAAGAHLIDSKEKNDSNAGNNSKEGLEIVRVILERDVEMDVQNNNGGTPVTIAIYHHRVNILRLLLSAGADPNYVNHHGWTPMMYAAIHCRSDLGRILLKFGGDPTIKSVFGNMSANNIAVEKKCTNWNPYITRNVR